MVHRTAAFYFGQEFKKFSTVRTRFMALAVFGFSGCAFGAGIGKMSNSGQEVHVT